MDNPERNKFEKLRFKAEEKIESTFSKIKELPEDKSEDIKKMLHELHVHQIELEMQNDELRRAQQQIEETREKYFDLYNLSPVCYFTFDREGNIKEFNLHASMIFDINQKSHIDSSFYKFIVKEDTDIFYWHLAKVFESGTQQSCELNIKIDDTKQLYAHIDSIALRNAEDRLKLCRTTITDISDLKKIELALRESEEKYRHLIENSNDAIYVLFNDRFILINKKFEDIFGLTLNEVNNASFDFMELVAPISRPFIRERTLRLKNNEELDSRYEFIALTKDKKEIEVEVWVSYIKYNGGTATQGILRDVSKHKRLEEQLHQAQKMESVGKLAGGIAHDFNNILTAIVGNADMMMLEMPADAQARTYAIDIRKAADRATQLTQQILTFARKQPLAMKVINPNKVIKNLENMLKRLIGENIELIFRLDPESGYIKADAGQISQIIMNLVVNSKEAISEKGTIIIETKNQVINEDNIDQYKHSETGKFVCLKVEDSGSGIDQANIDKIYEPFFTTKGMATSSGLGLSVVYGIVKQHNGWINVESKKGHGCTIRVFIPISLDIPMIKKEEIVPVSEFNGNNEKILIIEDEDIVRDYLIKLLRFKSYTVFSASNAKNAIEIFDKENGNFDLIFSDIVLPDMNGIKLVELLLSKNKNIPVLLGSGYSNYDSNWSDIEEKGLKFLSKPYSVPELLRALRQIFEH